MRTIKFMGKRLDNGEWVEGDLIQLDNQICIASQDMWATEFTKGTIELQAAEVDPATVTLVGLPTKQDIQRTILETATRTLTDEGVKMERIFEKEADAIINLFGLH